MDYFITGGSGFIGRRLIKKLLQRPNSRVHFLMRAAHLERVPELLAYWGVDQGESVNILLNFTQFFETRIEYRFQIFTAHSCDFLLPSYARLA
ncbi:SDR family oxidoreductase [Aeromonas salmonicida]|uniref:SDR family oxidoreductase n=1 Tax=Aeromonas salmonicida TaxID=645 RepID=UPI0039A6BB5A